MNRPTIALKHQQGQWYATANNVAARKVLGEERVPILRHRPCVTWDMATGRYVDGHDDVMGDWWRTEPASRAWREALARACETHRLVAIRKTRDDGSRTGSVGDWIGLYAILDYEIGDDGLVLRHEPGRRYGVINS